jgi:hypothetical protein
MALTLIPSGAYVGPEFSAEFGRIPPAFLPIGNRRLYQLQIDLLANRPAGERLALSLPDDFQLPKTDADILSDLGVEVVRIPKGLSLGESVVYALSALAADAGPLRILHGDTAIYDLPFDAPDGVTLHTTEAYHDWAEADVDEAGIVEIHPGSPSPQLDRPVLSGYFVLSRPDVFVRSLTLARGNFIAALNVYNAEHRLQPLQAGKWLDFGHVHTYYQSRRAITTERAFNNLAISERTVRKGSVHGAKLEAEIAWFKNLPDDVRVFTPQMYATGVAADGPWYMAEYCHQATLSDLFVFGRLPAAVWSKIFRACDAFLCTAAAHKPPADVEPQSAKLYLPKTMERLEAHARATGIDLEAPWVLNGQPLPGLRLIAEAAASRIAAPTRDHLGVVHGDFCFSNIFYDFRTQSIKVIDPRGVDGGGQKSIYGDGRYDVAKLYHSVIGLYDFIIAKRYSLNAVGRTLEFDIDVDAHVVDAQAVFCGLTYAGRDIEAAAAGPMAILLFLSMLPLHADDPRRQMAFVANALHLYSMEF